MDELKVEIKEEINELEELVLRPAQNNIDSNTEKIEENNDGGKPLQCSNCDANFAQKAPLIDHVESVHYIKRSSIDFIPRILLIKIGK